MNSMADLIRQCFKAYETKDRQSLEAILADDFTFSSPLDDNISRALYFERCWPNSEHLSKFNLIKLFTEGDEGFVTYVAESTDGKRFRNTEFFTIADGKISHVDVYFGSEDGASATEEEIRALMEETVAACRAKDANRLTKHYAPDVLAFDLINPLQYRGADEVRQRAEQWFSSFEGPITYELHDLNITAADNAAFCHSLNHVAGIQSGSKIDMWWRATVCLQKMDGQWLVTHLHSSEPFDTGSMKASIDLRP